MNWDKLSFNIKDVIQLAIFIVGGTLAISALSSKIDTIAVSVSAIQVDNATRKQDDKEKGDKKEVYDQQILNQINTNTIQIKLLEQDVKFLKENKR